MNSKYFVFSTGFAAQIAVFFPRVSIPVSQDECTTFAHSSNYCRECWFYYIEASLESWNNVARGGRSESPEPFSPERKVENSIIFPSARYT